MRGGRDSKTQKHAEFADVSRNGQESISEQLAHTEPNPAISRSDARTLAESDDKLHQGIRVVIAQARAAGRHELASQLRLTIELDRQRIEAERAPVVDLNRVRANRGRS